MPSLTDMPDVPVIGGSDTPPAPAPLTSRMRLIRADGSVDPSPIIFTQDQAAVSPAGIVVAEPEKGIDTFRPMHRVFDIVTTRVLPDES